MSRSACSATFRPELRDEPADLDRAWDLSRRFDEHPIYDMVYLALAERLITADTGLLRRAGLLDFVTGLED